MYRDINNYQTQVAPYRDAATKAVFPEAVYTLAEFALNVTTKQIFWSIAVWASVESFEQGGAPLATVKKYLLTDSTGLTFDAVLERFPAIKNDTGEALQILTAELDAGLHTKTDVIEE